MPDTRQIQRTRPDRVGGATFPTAVCGIASNYPGRRRGLVVLLHQLVGDLHVGSLHIPAGARPGSHLMPVDDGAPLAYRFTDAADPARVVFVTD